MEDWTEKYRPRTLDEVIGNDKALIEIKKWANDWNSGKPKYKALILSGKPGIGKTSCALALAREYNWSPIELNTSDARNAKKIKSVATYGAINETFLDDGSFVSSKKGGRKLIILDEADNLYERMSQSENLDDLSDRGGKKAIIETIKITSQPIILIVNDFYSLIRGSGEVLNKYCKHIKFYNPYSSYLLNLLKRICLSEGIKVDLNVLKGIADRSKGDIRSAVNDLQSISMNNSQININSLNVLGYRDREKDIFSSLREIFKTKDVKNIKDTLRNLDADPKLVMHWINENLPREYILTDDLANAYDYLSKADLFLGRTFNNQNFSLWSYACDMMYGGVASSKSRNYPNDKYVFPTYLKQRKKIKDILDDKSVIIGKICSNLHVSKKKVKEEYYSYFISIFKNDLNFAIKMKEILDLSDNEIKYLLGKSHSFKFDQIINKPKNEKIIDIKEDLKEEKKEEEIKEAKKQQSLLDF